MHLSDMETLRQLLGALFFTCGISIVAASWFYWIRVVLEKFGWRRVKFQSMAPFAAPLMITIGAFVFGEPLSNWLGWWVVLIDPNTYVFLLSIPFAVWQKRCADKQDGSQRDSDA